MTTFSSKYLPVTPNLIRTVCFFLSIASEQCFLLKLLPIDSGTLWKTFSFLFFSAFYFSTTFAVSSEGGWAPHHSLLLPHSPPLFPVFLLRFCIHSQLKLLKFHSKSHHDCFSVFRLRIAHSSFLRMEQQRGGERNGGKYEENKKRWIVHLFNWIWSEAQFTTLCITSNQTIRNA